MTAFAPEFIEQVFDYVVKLGITRPVSLEHNTDTQEVLVYPDRIVISVDDGTLADECIELVARARLGEEHPLLGTFYFQKDYTDQEGRWMSAFARLCGPLQKAWSYRILRECAPALYEQEVRDLFSEYVRIMGIKQNGTLEENFMVIEAYCILKDSPFFDVDMDTSGSDPLWSDYLHRLYDLIPMPAAPRYFCDLARASAAPYRVQILSENGFEYFDIRQL